jgi:ESCRT-II complex subunit VPS22
VNRLIDVSWISCLILASKGFWQETLHMGDFYYELSVQIVDVCLQTRSSLGGLIDIAELIRRLIKIRGKHAPPIAEYVSNYGIWDMDRHSRFADNWHNYRGIDDVSCFFFFSCVSLLYRDDILRSVKKLQVLGRGLEMVTIGSRKMLQSIPQEINMDHMTILTKAESRGYVLPSELRNTLKWTNERIFTVLVSIQN